MFPTLNILLYNVLPAAGRGDNLYGVEPPSYYLKNLFLNLGLAWPLAALSAVVLVADHVLAGLTLPVSSVKGTVIALSALLWLLVLFSRPHKVRYITIIITCLQRFNV